MRGQIYTSITTGLLNVAKTLEALLGPGWVHNSLSDRRWGLSDAGWFLKWGQEWWIPSSRITSLTFGSQLFVTILSYINIKHEISIINSMIPLFRVVPQERKVWDSSYCQTRPGAGWGSTSLRSHQCLRSLTTISADAFYFQSRCTFGVVCATTAFSVVLPLFLPSTKPEWAS